MVALVVQSKLTTSILPPSQHGEDTSWARKPIGQAELKEHRRL